MFNIGFAELIVVLLVAFLIVGPKDLPKVARWLARQVKTIRRVVNDLKKETGWDEMAREVDSVKKDVAQTMKDADITAELKDAKDSVEKSIDDVEKDIRDVEKDIRKEVEG